MAFNGGHVNCGRTRGTSVVVVVMCNGETNAVHFSFKGLECGDNAYVADGSSFWYVVKGDCLDGFGTVGAESVKFVAPAAFPKFCIRTFE